MKSLLAIDVVDSEKQPAFRVTAADGQQFVLNSFLVADSAGTPIWEFVRNEYEPVDDVEIVGVIANIDVLSDAFHEALRSDSWGDQRRVKRKPHTVHELAYGSIPVGYKQTIPEHGVPQLSAGANYRAVVSSSLGSGSAVFRAGADLPPLHPPTRAT